MYTDVYVMTKHLYFNLEPSSKNLVLIYDVLCIIIIRN